MIDVGLNLASAQFADDRAQVLQDAARAGVRGAIITGTDLPSSRAGPDYCRSHGDTLPLACTAGVHPHHAKDLDAEYWRQMERTADDERVVAIGETGLDFNRNYSPPQAQMDAFERHLELAARTGKPMFLHQRDAHAEFLELLRGWRGRLGRLVVHCFTEGPEVLADYLDLDCHIGITGWICDERRGAALRAAAPLVPDNRLMLETDAPYLQPRDLAPPPKTRRNVPANLPHILQATARHRRQTAAHLARTTTATTLQFFALPADWPLPSTA